MKTRIIIELKSAKPIKQKHLDNICAGVSQHLTGEAHSEEVAFNRVQGWKVWPK